MKKIQNSKFKIQNYGDGFTLIELLIVIAIIGVLATLLMANFVGVRQRARDSQRKSDLRQIQSALEIYRSDQDSYPTSLSACTNPLTGGTAPNLVTYMQKIPCDPNYGASSIYNSGSYYYNTPDGGRTYKLCTCLENGADSQGVKSSSDTAPLCSAGGGCNTSGGAVYYIVTNP